MSRTRLWCAIWPARGLQRRRASAVARACSPHPLLDGISSALEAGRLRSKVVRTLAGRRPCRLRGIEPRLAGRPAMALELVLALLLLGLAVLRVHDQRPRCRRRRCRSLALNLGRLTHRFVLADRGVPPIVDVVRIVVGNPVPPNGRVVQGQSRKIQTQSDAPPSPGTVPAASPTIIAARPAVAAVVPTIATVIAAAVAAAIAAAVAAAIAAAVAAVIAAAVATV